MFLSDAAVRRPVAMACLIIALTLLGFNAYRKVGLELMPRLDNPIFTIMTVYPGASPEEIETDIAKRIEDQVIQIEGLVNLNSTVMENACLTLLEFKSGMNPKEVMNDVREKVDLARGELPEDAEDPLVLKYDLNAQPIIQMALTGDLPVPELYDYADNTLRDRMTTIPGVADVLLIGGAKKEVQVLLDREKLGARGLTTLQVVETIKKEVRTIPAGRIREQGTEYSVKFDADYDRVGDIALLEVVNEDGQRCRIRDLGRVVMSTAELRQMARIDGRSAISIKVIKKSDANAVEVVGLVREAMAAQQQIMPGGMELVWVTDNGRFTESMVDSAWINLFQGVALTALILFFFLYDFRSLLVVALTMPLTVVISLFFMQWIDLTLNSSTLIAMGLSVGILVTNSIVVMEAIATRLAATGDPKASAKFGAKACFVAVLASAGTNAVVLFPLAMMQGRVGNYFKPYALTMLILTLVSLFISFTLTPLLCSVMLKAKPEHDPSILGRLERGWNRGFSWLTERMVRILTFFEKRRWAAVLMVLGVAILFAHAISLGKKVGMNLWVDPDQGNIYVKMEFPTRYDLGRTVARVNEAEALVRDMPEIKHVFTTVGKIEGQMGQASEGIHLAQILLNFSSKIERDLSLEDLKEMVRRRLAGFTDAIVSVNVASAVGGQGTAIELEISGTDLADLDRLATQTRDLVAELPGVRDPDSSARVGKPELRISPQRAVLADLHLPATVVGLALRGNLEGLEAGTFKQDARNYDIVVKMEKQDGKAQIPSFLFPGAPGRPILLSNFGRIQETVAPIQINRHNKMRTAMVYANLEAGKSQSEAVAQIRSFFDTQVQLPMGYSYRFAGMVDRMEEAEGDFIEAGVIAIVLVVLTLAAILESFQQPWLVLLTIPLALIGTYWVMFLSNTAMDTFSLMSSVMLIGIVVNNAILIMDRFNFHVSSGVARHEAMITATKERLRPIVMTSLAAVLGMMPIAVGTGIGAEIRNASGLSALGGIISSGLLALFVIPVMYNLFTRKAPAAKCSCDSHPRIGDACTVSMEMKAK